MNLHPFVELAKQITDSPFCEINITDEDYQQILIHSDSDIKAAPQGDSICYETIRKKGVHEIENLFDDSIYRNLPYVQGIPHIRYYCGVKLTTSTGIDIGTIAVLDSDPKRITTEQKLQFKILALSVAMTIESEFNHRNITGELDTFKDNLEKLNHDLSSPIRGIISMTDLLIKNQKEIKVQTQDIQIIKKSAQSIIDIMSGVLTTLDVEKNREEMKKNKLLSKVLDKIESLYNPLALNKNITLSLKYQLDREVWIPYYFHVKLLRIIGNLASNAIKFSPKNVTVDIIFSGKSEGEQALLNIAVRNTGKVLSSEQITAFTNGNPVLRPYKFGRQKSFGTGLQHIYEMVSEEGGNIEIESTKKTGTTFTITLPIPSHEETRDREPAASFTNGFPKPAVNGKRV